jgi:hypothetical protein
MVKRNRHIGSSLDDLLVEEQILEKVTARAIKRVADRQTQQASKNKTRQLVRNK